MRKLDCFKSQVQLCMQAEVYGAALFLCFAKTHLVENLFLFNRIFSRVLNDSKDS